MENINYDLAIIGDGAAGLVAGVAAGAVGARTIIIEKEERLGGECSWTGCVPSKAFIHQASLAYRSGSRTEDNVMEEVRETVLKASKASKVKALLDSYGLLPMMWQKVKLKSLLRLTENCWGFISLGQGPGNCLASLL